MRLLEVINTTWKNLQIAEHKSVRWPERTPYWFVLWDLQVFSGGVYHLVQPHAHCLFLFRIVFVFLFRIPFSKPQRKKMAQSCIRSPVFVSSITCRAIWEAVPERRVSVFGNWKCEVIANFRATVVTVWISESRGTKSANFGHGKVWAQRNSCNVTSVCLSLSVSLSLWLSLSLSLSLSLFFLSLSHLTHLAPQYTKRGSAWYNKGAGLFGFIVVLSNTAFRPYCYVVQTRDGSISFSITPSAIGNSRSQCSGKLKSNKLARACSVCLATDLIDKDEKVLLTMIGEDAGFECTCACARLTEFPQADTGRGFLPPLAHAGSTCNARTERSCEAYSRPKLQNEFDTRRETPWQVSVSDLEQPWQNAYYEKRISHWREQMKSAMPRNSHERTNEFSHDFFASHPQSYKMIHKRHDGWHKDSTTVFYFQTFWRSTPSSVDGHSAGLTIHPLLP